MAGPRSSASYSIPAETFDAGGAAASSASYQTLGSAGSIVGRSTAANLELGHGYLAQIATAPLQVLGAISRKTHGAAGPFDIDLPLTGAAGIESRIPGIGDSHQVIVTFADPVSVAGVSVMSSDGQAAGSASANQSVVTLNLTGVANAQTLGVTLVQVNNGSETANVFVPLGVLLGDTNGNGAVTSSDISQTKGRSGQAIDNTNFRSDVNISGTFTASDISLVKTKAGTGLP